MLQKKISLLAATLFLFSFTPPVKKKITIFMAGDSTMSVKEIRAYPETGWGMPFAYFWDSSVTVINKAKNGRSTKTFISEGLWGSIMQEAKEGDYIFIQFGHNDEVKEKTDRYSTPDSFKINLTRFIADAKAKKTIPILLTPVSRRQFDSAGNAMQTHVYSPYVKEVAKQEKVLFIDLDSLSIQLYQQMGKTNSSMLFMQLKPGEHPNYPQGKDDNTHFNELGARLVAQLVLKQLEAMHIELTDHLYHP